MKIKDLIFFLNKLNDNGFGDVELYTEWEEEKNGYTGKPPEFHLYLNGINEKEILEWWPQNPFNPGIDFHSFGISKECSIHEYPVKLSGCFDVYNKCLENKKYIDEVRELNSKIINKQEKLAQEYVSYINDQKGKRNEI